MAKGIQQTAGDVSGGMTQASEAVASASQAIGQREYRVGENLANDLLGFMGAKNKNINMGINVGEDIATRIAMDKSTQLALFINEQKKITNFDNPDEMEKFNTAVQNEQVRLSKETFIMPSSQDAFDKNFTEPAIKDVSAITTTVEMDRLKIMREREAQLALESTNIEQNANIYPTNMVLDTRAKQISAGDPNKVEKGWASLADTSVLQFTNLVDSNMQSVLDVGGYDPKAGFTTDVQKNIFDKLLGGYGTLGENGEVVFEENVQGEVARDKIQKAWYGFRDSFLRTLEANDNLSTSTIPESSNKITLNGAVPLDEVAVRIGKMNEELEKRLEINPNLASDPKFQKLEDMRDAAVVKQDMLNIAEVNYTAFSKGDIEWDEYLKRTSETARKFEKLGQDMTIEFSYDDAKQFAQRKFDHYEDALRNANYDDVLAMGTNPFMGAAEIERKSGGALKSSYLSGLATDFLGNKGVKGNSYNELKSEFGKTIDYMTGKKTLEGTWADGQTNNINTIFKTLDAQVASGAISENAAMLRVKGYMEGLQNQAVVDKNIYNSDRSKALKATFNELDADTVAGYGWLNVEVGNMEFAQYSKSLAMDVFNKDTSINIQSEDAVSTFVSNRFIPVRNSEGATGNLALPFKKAILINTGGRDLKQDNVGDLIAYRLKKELGDKYADVTDDTVSISQYRDDRGEIITSVAVAESYGQPAYKILNFTMDEFEKGVPAMTKAEKEAAVKEVEKPKRKHGVATIR